MKLRPGHLAGLAAGLGLVPWGHASERFPKPDFSTPYQPPAEPWTGLGSNGLEILDMGLLAAALALAAWLALRRRSRFGLVLLSLACLGYFGFWRQGCVCPVGSVQAVAESLATGAPLPLLTVVFFVLPLLAALLFGRVFCAAVCPLGILQDLVAVRPHRLSPGLQAGLQVIPVFVLALTVLLAMTQTAYLACRFDPFVPLLRRAGTAHGVLMGAAMLGLGIVLARPYCRLICPYGVLLRGLSRLSWRHLTITPTTCVQCRLCADACPFDAILPPTPEAPAEPLRTGTRRLGWLLLAAPALVLVGVAGLAAVGPALAGRHQDTRLMAQLRLEEAGAAPPTVESVAYRESGRTLAELESTVASRRQALRRGGAWAGAFVGLVLAARLIGASVRRRRTDFVPDRGDCVSCGRCFRYCPQEHARRRQPGES